MNALVQQPNYNAKLPAFLRSPDLFSSSSGLTGGITGGQPPTISIKGSKWALLDGNGETLYVQQLTLDVIVVGGNRHVSKTFYDGPYDPSNSGPPDCWSDNGQAPSSQASSPQHANCATCPKNAFGSKVNEATGAGMKACSDSKKLAVVLAAPTQCLVNGAAQTVQPFGQVYLLRLPAMSMRPWKEFAEGVEKHGVPIRAGVNVRLSFDPTASYPKVAFAATGMTTEDQYNGFKQHIDSEQMKAAVGANDLPFGQGVGNQSQVPVVIPVALPSALPQGDFTSYPTAGSAAALALPTTLPSPTPPAAAPAPERKRGRPKASAAPPAAPIPAPLPEAALPAAFPNGNGAIQTPTNSDPALDAKLAELFG